GADERVVEERARKREGARGRRREDVPRVGVPRAAQRGRYELRERVDAPAETQSVRGNRRQRRRIGGINGDEPRLGEGGDRRERDRRDRGVGGDCQGRRGKGTVPPPKGDREHAAERVERRGHRDGGDRRRIAAG